MCRVFPTVTSCNLPNVGAGGGEQVKSHVNVSNGQHLHGDDYVYSFLLVANIPHLINARIYIHLYPLWHLLFTFKPISIPVLISGPQWPLRPHSEHHQWEDIPYLMVVVSAVFVFKLHNFCCPHFLHVAGMQHLCACSGHHFLFFSKLIISSFCRYAILAPISIAFFFYRLCTIMLDPYAFVFMFYFYFHSLLPALYYHVWPIFLSLSRLLFLWIPDWEQG